VARRQWPLKRARFPYGDRLPPCSCCDIFVDEPGAKIARHKARMAEDPLVK
jgi:hypothetical protein